MPTCARIDAVAKINLHLDVGPVRPDGFHPIVSLFQAISLHDTVSVEPMRDSGIRLEADCGCPERENTMWKAASAWLEAAGSDSGLVVRCEKRIPSGAGLGGGSSDAAAVLRALDGLARKGRIGAPQGFPALRALGARIGSDVPFFLPEEGEAPSRYTVTPGESDAGSLALAGSPSGTAAIVTGRGERTRPIPPRTDYRLVLLVPDFGVSTGDAYRELDASGRLELGPLDVEELERRYRGEEPSAWGFRNTFYGPLSESREGLRACVRALRGSGASFAAMTGSGSVCFGAFASAAAADAAARFLSDRGFEVLTAEPLASWPALHYY